MNLSALSQTANKALTLSNLILVSPQGTVGYQPQNAPSYSKNTAAQPPALIFNYEGEQVATLSSDITDHYIENNSAIQDQIALKPETITTQGFVGELNNVPPGLLAPLKTIADKLVAIGAYAPQVSVTAALAYANAFAAYQIAESLLNTGVSIWGVVTGSGGESVINGSGLDSSSNQNQQQKYFQQFYGYWKNRTLFTVQTPWAVFQDMAIESLRAVQDADTRMITDFEITFKLMRFASTLTVLTQLDASNFQGRAAASASGVVDMGVSSLIPSPNLFFGSVV